MKGRISDSQGKCYSCKSDISQWRYYDRYWEDEGAEAFGSTWNEKTRKILMRKVKKMLKKCKT